MRRALIATMLAASLPCLVMAGQGDAKAAFSLRSDDFRSGQPMPVAVTCEGEDRSPALAWSGAPQGTKSLALVMDDPDAPDPKAPQRRWVHWVLYDIPPSATGLAPGAAGQGLPAGTRQGRNDWKRAGYGGPCPPIGRHRYVHTLYALDTMLGDRGPLTKAGLEDAMRGHVLAQTELVGTYEKRGR